MAIKSPTSINHGTIAMRLANGLLKSMAKIAKSEYNPAIPKLIPCWMKILLVWIGYT